MYDCLFWVDSGKAGERRCQFQHAHEVLHDLFFLRLKTKIEHVKILGLTFPPQLLSAGPILCKLALLRLKMGGGFDRWMLCHHLQLLERAVKRLPGSADNGAPEPAEQSSPAWHVLNPHLAWILPSLLQLILSLHQLSTPQARPATMIGAKSKCFYSLKRSTSLSLAKSPSRTLRASRRILRRCVLPAQTCARSSAEFCSAKGKDKPWCKIA